MDEIFILKLRALRKNKDTRKTLQRKSHFIIWSCDFLDFANVLL